MEEVIILDIKPDYALVMAKGGEVLRAKRRKGMAVGEQIYLLPEDVCPGRGGGEKVDFSAALRRVRSGTLPRKILAAAAMLALILTLLLPNFGTKAYAVLDVAAEERLELQVDREQRVLRAASPENRIAKQELKALKGKNVLTLEPELERLLGGRLTMVIYAPYEGELDEQFERSLREAYETEGRLVLAVSAEQLAEARTQQQSLGEYAQGHQELLAAWLDELDDEDLDDLEESDEDEDDRDEPDEDDSEDEEAESDEEETEDSHEDKDDPEDADEDDPEDEADEDDSEDADEDDLEDEDDSEDADEDDSEDEDEGENSRRKEDSHEDDDEED